MQRYLLQHVGSRIAVGNSVTGSNHQDRVPVDGMVSVTIDLHIRFGRTCGEFDYGKVVNEFVVTRITPFGMTVCRFHRQVFGVGDVVFRAQETRFVIGLGEGVPSDGGMDLVVMSGFAMSLRQYNVGSNESTAAIMFQGDKVREAMRWRIFATNEQVPVRVLLLLLLWLLLRRVSRQQRGGGR